MMTIRQQDRYIDTSASRFIPLFIAAKISGSPLERTFALSGVIHYLAGLSGAWDSSSAWG
jgi:hypothetical protein